MIDRSDVLIVGGGLAGLFLALRLAPRRCTLISPASLGTSASSAWAQGGLAAALAPDDTPEAHAEDTILAGDGLVDPVTAALIAEDGPKRVEDLVKLGVPFDRTAEGALALSLEAAHSKPRVARVAGDLAGQAIMGALSDAALSARHITINTDLKAVDILQTGAGRVVGVMARDGEGQLHSLHARETVFCTGGSGGLFAVTTNPRESRGDSIAMAYRAGALLSDLEFVQFHPTAIDIGRDPAPLATEALRGEGARLVNRNGEPFMPRHDPMGELAPRDRVARAVHIEWISDRGAYLDTREAIGDHIAHHFPTVFGSCKSAGIDPRTDIIPIAPAAHYHMGGIVTDSWGKTSLDGLSACGECSSTGAHGANRLASNSLLEVVVFAARIADRLREADLAEIELVKATDPPPDLSEEDLQSLRRNMAMYCGVVRDATGLNLLKSDIASRMSAFGLDAMPRALVACDLIVRSALRREESRGGHFREDFPVKSDKARRNFLYRGSDGPVFIEQDKGSHQ